MLMVAREEIMDQAHLPQLLQTPLGVSKQALRR